jgi:hypothetical protein
MSACRLLHFGFLLLLLEVGFFLLPPPVSWVKCNTDGAAIGTPSQASYPVPVCSETIMLIS